MKNILTPIEFIFGCLNSSTDIRIAMVMTAFLFQFPSLCSKPFVQGKNAIINEEDIFVEVAVILDRPIKNMDDCKSQVKMAI